MDVRDSLSKGRRRERVGESVVMQGGTPSRGFSHLIPGTPAYLHFSHRNQPKPSFVVI